MLTESCKRLYSRLYCDLGNEMIRCLQDPHINEIMCNPDGGLWVDHSLEGLISLGHLTKLRAFSIIYSVAGIHHFLVNYDHPQLEAQLPYFECMQGERFTAQVPPIVLGPSFSIRKKSAVIFKLQDYIDTQRLTETQASVLRELVRTCKNIIICGGPGSGKTTVTNTLIAEAILFDSQQRFLILEDLAELNCHAVNQVAMCATADMSMTHLLRLAMRMRPDRILVGEVRGREALDMLKAWNTGCPGGMCTIHANGAEEAIQRIIDLTMEGGLMQPPIQLIMHTIESIVEVQRKNNQKGFIAKILSLGEYKNEKFVFKRLA